SLFFFFQAEDGIRDFHVTGVQTCALPIFGGDGGKVGGQGLGGTGVVGTADDDDPLVRQRGAGVKGGQGGVVPAGDGAGEDLGEEIGRASCREREERLWVADTSAKAPAAQR